ncbi:snare associated Golgi protein-domain-containing protein [Linnemannia elongata]|nr:snare associated Golgi protein-domain-containing protein [Linnemannia elongata]
MNINLVSVGGESLVAPLLVSPTSPTSPQHRHHHQHSHSSSPPPSPPSSSSGRVQHQKQQRQEQHFTGITSIPVRLIQWGLSILFRIRAALPATIRPWFWVGLWLVFVAIGVGIFAGFYTKIFHLLEAMANVIKGLGQAGPPIMMLALFLTAFPPVFGYSSLITMSGYVYGFGLGLFIAYTSALLGSIACFYLCRRSFKVQVRALMAKKQSMKSVVKAVEKRGFKLLVLIRLAPYPFNVMNALLSATHIPLSTFALATALSLTKLALHVYIGSTLPSLAPITTPPEGETTNPDGSLPPTIPVNSNTHGRNLKIVFMVISIIIGLAVSAYVWTVAKREIAASEGIRIERRRKRRASMRQSRASMRSVEGLGSGRDNHPQGHLLARSGSSGGIVELGQDNMPTIDLTSSGSDFVGGATGFSINGYQDEEDDGLEDQALVGSGGERSSHHLHSLSRSGLNVAVGGGSGRADYGSESDESDFLDDEDDYDDDDMSDMERGIDNDDDSNVHGRNSRRSSFTGQNSTEMDVRNPLPRHTQGSSLGTSQNTMGWFAEHGVDISDNDRERGW